MIEEWGSSVLKGDCLYVIHITYFKHRSEHKCTTLAMGQDEVEVKSMIDLVLVKRYVLHDVSSVRRMRRSLSVKLG